MINVVCLRCRCEVSQISVGPTGLVWAITWHGKAMVRLGITRIDPLGQSWSVIEPPGPSSALSMGAVGHNVVWALTRDKCTWFRNGVHGDGSGESEALARGLKWVGMVGELAAISVGPFDQVVAIQDDAERSIVIRTGVTNSDLTGKTWKVINAGISLEPAYATGAGSARFRASIAAQYDSSNDTKDSATKAEEKPDVEQGSSNENFRKKGAEFGDKFVKSFVPAVAASAARATVGRVPIAGQVITQMTYSAVSGEMQKVKINQDDEKDQEQDKDSSRESSREKSLPPGGVDQSIYRSALENHDDDTKSFSGVSVSSGEAAILDREEQYDDNDFEGSGPQWVWLAFGSCKLDPTALPKPWFVDAVSNNGSLSGESWRINILQVHIHHFFY